MTGEQPDTEFRKGVEHDGCLDRFAGYAYADSHDRMPCDGNDGEHCAGGRGR